MFFIDSHVYYMKLGEVWNNSIDRSTVLRKLISSFLRNLFRRNIGTNVCIWFKNKRKIWFKFHDSWKYKYPTLIFLINWSLEGLINLRIRELFLFFSQGQFKFISQEKTYELNKRLARLLYLAQSDEELNSKLTLTRIKGQYETLESSVQGPETQDGSPFSKVSTVITLQIPPHRNPSSKTTRNLHIKSSPSWLE